MELFRIVQTGSLVYLVPLLQGPPGAVNKPYLLPLPRRLTFSKTRLFSLMLFELGELLWWRKGPPFSPAEMPAVRLNLVMTLLVGEQLLFPLFTTLSLICPAPPTIKFLFCEVEENNVIL